MNCNEINRSIINQQMPLFSYPYVSTFVGYFKTSEERVHVTAGETFSLVGETACKFSTLYDVDLFDWHVDTSFVLDNPYASTPGIKLKFTKNKCDVFPCTSEQTICLYIDAAYNQALRLFYLMTQKIVKLGIYIDKKFIWLGGQDDIKPFYKFYNHSEIYPFSHSINFPSVCLDYFCAPKKLFFLGLEGLPDEVMSHKSGNFELYCFFSTQELFFNSLSKDIFKLNCVPMVNLFKEQTEPVTVNSLRSVYQLVLKEGEKNLLYDVFCVEAVASTGHVTELNKISQVNAVNDGSVGRFDYFRLKNDNSWCLRLFLSELEKIDFLSVLAFCYNQEMIFAQDKLLYFETSPHLLPDTCCRNLQKPTETVFAPDLNLLSYGYHFSSFAKKGTLQKYLRLFNWSIEERGEKIINSIQTCQIKKQQELSKGIVSEVYKIAIRVYESNNLDLYEYNLFGFVLNTIFAGMIDFGVFFKITLFLTKNNDCFDFPLTQGEKCVI